MHHLERSFMCGINSVPKYIDGVRSLASPLTTVDFQIHSAGIVIIGNEILSGMTTDYNSQFMARELNSYGVKVCRTAIIPDEVAEIKKTVWQFSNEFTHVFTSGGIGPTHDDVTIEAISAAFQVKTVVHPYLKCLLRERFGDNLTSEKLKMAQIPEGAKLITDQCLKFPLIKFRNVFILPGVPKLLRDKFAVSIKSFRSHALFVKKIHVARCESEIATFLNNIVRDHREVRIGSYPSGKNGCSSVLITLEACRKHQVQKALEHLMLGLPDKSITQIE
jgi:FAD synthetase